MCVGFAVVCQDEDGNVIVPSSEAGTVEGVVGLQKTPRPLQNESFMGDVVTLKVRQNQAFKFVFKRKIFLKAMDDPSDDVMFERLVYLQVRSQRACVVCLCACVPVCLCALCVLCVLCACVPVCLCACVPACLYPYVFLLSQSRLHHSPS